MSARSPLPPGPGRRHYAAVFVLCLSILVLQIALARVLSVALHSHYAFVAISLAMFGLGLSGLVVYLLPGRFPPARVDTQLVAVFWLFGLSAVLSTLAFLNLTVEQSLSWRGFTTLGLAYTVLAVPFFFGGLGVSLLMTHFSAAMGRLYAADLLGASAGCIAVVAAMQVLPAPQVPALAGVLACATALVLARGGWRGRALPALAAALALGLVAGVPRGWFAMRSVKGVHATYSAYEAWNAFSRVSAFEYSGDAGQALGLGHDPTGGDVFPDTMMLDIDGTAWTPMLEFDGDLSRMQFLRRSALYLAHHLRPAASVLIIGTGGGRDLLAARVFGQPAVLGIELNPLMAHIVEERYGNYSGRPYSTLGAEVVIDEARSHLAGLDRRFDVIQLSLIDTFSLNAAGGVVFSENYLYTTEAFREYFRHLTPNGVLSVSRYFVPRYPLEVLRILAMARAAWEAEGVADFPAHVAVLGQGVAATVLVKRSPFTAAEVAQMEALRQDFDLDVRYLPGVSRGNPEVRAFLATDDVEGYLALHPFILHPPTDDRPFFFHFLRGRLAEIPSLDADPFRILEQWNDALSLMYLLVAVVTVLAAVFFLGPLLLFGRADVARLPVGLTVPLLLYFCCLGYGFMMIEIPLMQRFVLFLGYPIYALAVILFALLLFSGLGSLASSRLAARADRALPMVLAGIVGLATLYVWGLPRTVAALMALPVATKIALTVVSLGPLGLLLGMAYPLGIALLRRAHTGLVPWAWGVNGALSVVASVFASFLGSRVGFSTAMLTGVAAYGLAFGLVWRVRRRVVSC